MLYIYTNICWTIQKASKVCAQDDVNATNSNLYEVFLIWHKTLKREPSELFRKTALFLSIKIQVLRTFLKKPTIFMTQNIKTNI